MSNDSKKSQSDIGELMQQLDLGTFRYREFGQPAKSALSAVSSKPGPQARPAPKPESTTSRPAQAAKAAETPLRAVSSNPLSFTFERLRQQSIATTTHTPCLTLDLPERHAIHIDRMPSANQRSLAEIFRELDRPPLRTRNIA